MNDKTRFLEVTEKLVCGLLREALGYSIEGEVPYYRGISGFMVEAPLLWIKHSRFPILFVAYEPGRAEILENVVKQVAMSKATEYFALLIVVPMGDSTGHEAEELRLMVNGSEFRHDFVVLDREHLASIISQNSSRRLVEIILEQGIALSSLSPYVVRGPVPPNMFFGREAEIKEISQAIMQTNYALVGGRRIGKSSVLQSLNRLWSRSAKHRACYLNCENLFDHAGFYDAISVLFDDQLPQPSLQGIRQLAYSLKRADPRQMVILLDEVDELLDFDAAAHPAGQLFKSFRALAHEGIWRFVFSGSKTLHRHLHDGGSPFFNFCQDLTLRPLSEKSVAEIVSKPMRQLGVELIDEERFIGRMIDLTSCHPSLVQWLCDQLLRGADRRVIDEKDLDRLASSEDYCNYFRETAWGDATPLEMFVSVLIETPEFSLNDLFVAAADYGVTDRRAIQGALQTLRLYSLVEKHGDRYRYILRQFPRIVRGIEDLPTLIEGWLSRMEA